MRDDEPRLFFAFDGVSSQTWLTTLLEEMPVAVGLFDDSGKLMFGNRHFSEEAHVVGRHSAEWRSISPDGGTVAEGVFPCLRVRAQQVATSPTIPIYLIQPKGCGEDLAAELQHSAHRLNAFPSAADFLNVAEVLQPGCVVVDLRYSEPNRNGLLDVLQLRPFDLQVILLGPQDTPADEVIAALKGGAADYLLEPSIAESLPGALKKAAGQLRGHFVALDDHSTSLHHQVLSLPRRERQVMLGLLAGGTNKSIARSLQLSPRTVEVHRSHLMQRLNVKTLTELLHLARDAGLKATGEAAV